MRKVHTIPIKGRTGEIRSGQGREGADGERDADGHDAGKMLKMHEHMHKIMQAKDPKERDKLMHEHMQMMQEHMKMMGGTKGDGMMGPGMMGGARWGHAKGGMMGH